MKTIPTFFIITVLMAAPLDAAESKSIVLRHWGGSDFRDYFVLHQEEVAKLPHWNPQMNVAPPVSISKVIVNSLPLIRNSAKGWPWRIRTITLVNGQGEGAKDIWFYEVSANIEALIDSQAKSVSLHILVLMDGTILLPEVEIPENPNSPAPDPIVRPESAFNTAEKIVLSKVGLQSGEKYVYEISKSVALSLPDWYAESGKPVPLETNDILADLHKLVKEHIPGQEWDLQSFRLMCGGKGGGKPPESRHISYYSVALMHHPKGSMQEKKYWNILILLDGSAVFPDPLVFPE